jgi:hypothetical protein
MIFFICILYTDRMKKKTFPKGTRESSSKGFMSKNGTKHFVHIVNTKEFYRSYPYWKSKNPSVNHVYEFEGRLVSGNKIMNFLKQNMNPLPRRSPRRANGKNNNNITDDTTPFKRITRSMTRSKTITPSPSKQRTTRRKQTKPTRSYFE